jgi:hypothetical protein
MITPTAPADTTPASSAAGGIVHMGLFFVPALVVLAVGAVKLWGEQR